MDGADGQVEFTAVNDGYFSKVGDGRPIIARVVKFLGRDDFGSKLAVADCHFDGSVAMPGLAVRAIAGHESQAISTAFQSDVPDAAFGGVVPVA